MTKIDGVDIHFIHVVRSILLDHDASSLALMTRVFDGQREGLTRDDVLDSPEELYQAPRSWTERAYPKRVYYKKQDKGGHFAAWEQAELPVSDLRAGSGRFGSRNDQLRGEDDEHH